jgi:hypothetical protein
MGVAARPRVAFSASNVTPAVPKEIAMATEPKPTEPKATEPEAPRPEVFEPKTLYRGAEQALADTPAREAELRWNGFRSNPPKKTTSK